MLGYVVNTVTLLQSTQAVTFTDVRNLRAQGYQAQVDVRRSVLRIRKILWLIKHDTKMQWRTLLVCYLLHIVLDVEVPYLSKSSKHLDPSQMFESIRY